MPFAFIATSSRIALLTVSLCGLTHAQQRADINFNFAIDDKATSVAHEDALCKRACDAAVWTEAWMPWIDQSMTQCGVRVDSQDVTVNSRFPITALVPGKAGSFDEARAVCGAALTGRAWSAFGQCMQPDGSGCKRPRGARTGENDTAYGVQCTCNTGYMSDPTRDDPNGYQ